MKTIGTFTIIKNEVDYIGYNIMSVLDFVDAMYFLDGKSTDGTVELIEHIKKKYDKEDKIHLYSQKDHGDYTEKYMGMWNDLLKKIDTDYAWFLHPDMITINPETIRPAVQSGRIRYSVKMVSFAGDRGHVFSKGRDPRWASIYANSFGLHFHGYYGAVNEDFYFKDFTGSEHVYYKNVKYLPYEVVDADINVYHYCDTRDFKERKNKMSRILSINYKDKYTSDEIEAASSNHPRVTIKETKHDFGREFEIVKTNLEEPEVFKIYAEEFKGFRKAI